MLWWQGDVWKLLWVGHHYFVKAYAVHSAVKFQFDLLLQVPDVLLQTTHIIFPLFTTSANISTQMDLRRYTTEGNDSSNMMWTLLTFSAWAWGLREHIFLYAGDCQYQEMVFLSRWACSPQTSGRGAEPLCSPSHAGQIWSARQTHVGLLHWIIIWSWAPSTWCLLAWCSYNWQKWKAYVQHMVNDQEDKRK